MCLRAVLNALKPVDQMQIGDWKCLECSHIGPAESFQTSHGQFRLSADSRCPQCGAAVQYTGYAVKDTDGRIRRGDQ